jgi:hypothetical protein
VHRDGAWEALGDGEELAHHVRGRDRAVLEEEVGDGDAGVDEGLLVVLRGVEADDGLDAELLEDGGIVLGTEKSVDKVG